MSRRAEPRQSTHQDEIVEYYSEAGQDYSAWSTAFNMHFGYWKAWLNPLRLEPMLEAMNSEILRRVAPTAHRDPCQLLDAGCGLGATARHIARNSKAHLRGITIVPWQVENAARLAEASGLSGRIEFELRDFRNTRLPGASFDGIYALESSCYAEGPDKSDFLREAHRLLRPGGRLVIADGFLSRTQSRANTVYRHCLERMHNFWAIDTFAHRDLFLRAMETAGFRDIEIENAAFRIAPSVLFIPWVTARFFFVETILKRRRLTAWQKANALAPLFGLVAGLHMHRFSYCIISARR